MLGGVMQGNQSSQVLCMHIERFSQNKHATHLKCLGACMCRVTASGSLQSEDQADHRGDDEQEAKHPIQQENEDGEDQQSNA
jgi:hypothetical protein